MIAISIHAPTRGATTPSISSTLSLIISIHAPTRGATLHWHGPAVRSPYFNPRSYKRSDFYKYIIVRICLYFNPRSYKRSDSRLPCVGALNNEFQSTLLQEERRSALVCGFFWSLNFNPRSYKRSDFRCNSILQVCLISIHAPTRGATSKNLTTCYNKRNFNPRSYKRSDSISTAFRLTCAISIHAPTRGATAKMHNIPHASLQ